MMAKETTSTIGNDRRKLNSIQPMEQAFEAHNFSNGVTRAEMIIQDGKIVFPGPATFLLFVFFTKVD